MLKKFLFISSIFLLMISCKKENKPTINDSYVVNLSIDNVEGKKAYLQQLSALKSIDSTTITNGKAIFKGSVKTPERYLITIESVFGGKMIILENDSINIVVNNDDLIYATITGSKLNDELVAVQKKSEEIYNKIDLLFPDLQRARLENDSKKLAEISSKMKAIEAENINFHFDYAQKHPNSFLSAMIVRDLIKRDSIDIDRVKTIYNLFPKEVKNSADAKVIASFLTSH